MPPKSRELLNKRSLLACCQLSELAIEFASLDLNQLPLCRHDSRIIDMFSVTEGCLPIVDYLILQNAPKITGVVE
jgi:hypothetical protein